MRVSVCAHARARLCTDRRVCIGKVGGGGINSAKVSTNLSKRFRDSIALLRLSSVCRIPPDCAIRAGRKASFPRAFLLQVTHALASRHRGRNAIKSRLLAISSINVQLLKKK